MYCFSQDYYRITTAFSFANIHLFKNTVFVNNRHVYSTLAIMNCYMSILHFFLFHLLTLSPPPLRTDTKISLSTASPNVGGTPPELSTLRLNLLHFNDATQRENYYRVRGRGTGTHLVTIPCLVSLVRVILVRRMMMIMTD